MSAPGTTAPPRPAPFAHPVRVYWEDTDAGGVVYYANYLRFFERARTEWLRNTGHAQQAVADASGAIFVVTDSRVRYLRPARLDDALLITVEPSEIGRARMLITQRAWRGDTLLCEGEIAIACVDRGTFRPRRIPNELLPRTAE